MLLAGLAFTALGALLYITRFQHCPENRLLVVFGAGLSSSDGIVVTKNGRFVWPILQSHAYLSLKPIALHTPHSDTTVRISDNPDVARNAAIHLLQLSVDEIRAMAAKALAEDATKGDSEARLAAIGLDRVQRRTW